jgi:hypothetical protein
MDFRWKNTFNEPQPGKMVQLIRNGKKAKLSGNPLSFHTKENELIIWKEI